ncbi:hypothetical protein NDU88_001268 [Pleurodeles waltl]|uniref:Uncharacterized protein n=1 Tax=Pleurodeles waltl TaxID=8319 RepID=A0AAV7WHX8_PLEWA|nr:hypothetical protein NDU88_001268 [Pleurodeles waltl]
MSRHGLTLLIAALDKKEFFCNLWKRLQFVVRQRRFSSLPLILNVKSNSDFVKKTLPAVFQVTARSRNKESNLALRRCPHAASTLLSRPIPPTRLRADFLLQLSLSDSASLNADNLLLTAKAEQLLGTCQNGSSSLSCFRQTRLRADFLFQLSLSDSQRQHISSTIIAQHYGSL